MKWFSAAHPLFGHPLTRCRTVPDTLVSLFPAEMWFCVGFVHFIIINGLNGLSYVIEQKSDFQYARADGHSFRHIRVSQWITAQNRKWYQTHIVSHWGINSNCKLLHLHLTPLKWRVADYAPCRSNRCRTKLFRSCCTCVSSDVCRWSHSADRLCIVKSLIQSSR